MKKIFIFMFVLLIGFAAAADFTPQGNINMRGIYNMTGAPFVNATLFYGNGSQLIGISASGGGDGNASSICADGTFLNGDGTCDAGYLDADGVDDYEADTNTQLSGAQVIALVGNWTLDKASYYTSTIVDTLISSVGNWSADKAGYWDTANDLDTVISTDEITELKIDFNTACGAGSHLYVSGNNLACEADDDTTYSALSEFSDDIGVSADWDAIGDVPTATPSNGDTTHLSTADQIYDWVIGLGYATTSWVNTQLGNYYLKTAIDTQGEVETIWGTTLATDGELSSGLAGQDACSEISGCVVGAITSYSETDPLWTANFSLYNTSWSTDTDTNTQLSQENVEDYAGGMASGTETRISFTYNDGTGNFDLVVDDMNDDNPEAGDVLWSDLTDQGTFTDTKYCTYASGTGYISCTSEGGVSTTYYAGTGLDLNGSDYFEIEEAFRMPQGCNNGEIAEYNTTSSGWDCAVDNSAASGMASWVLATSDTAGSESITDGETVTIDSGTGITATRSTNTVTITNTVTDTTCDDGSCNVTNTGTLDGYEAAALLDNTDTQLTEEEVEDFVGGMLGGTETHIAVTYEDGTNDIDFVVSDDWYNSIADIPTATPSNGDTTHVSTADQIFDYIASLSHLVAGDLVGLIGNWTADKGDYSTTTEADALYRAESWDNFTGIPHATPANGDVTHFSWGDEIYDWVIGLGYSTTTGTVTSVAAGDGMDFSSITSSGSATLGTPGTSTGSTSNAVTATSHTHEVTTDDTGDCESGVICGGGHTHSNYIQSLFEDTTPQLGGYLDTAGQNIGSTTDEIENIYMATNSRIYFGDGQEASIYYNGTALIGTG